MGDSRLLSVDLDTHLPPGDVLDALDGRGVGKYAPPQGASPSNRFVFLGDSITQGSDQVSTNFRGTAWPLIAAIRSAGRIVHVRNSGISGNTTQNMIDRFDTDVTPHAPTVVSVLAGTNDSAPATFAAWTEQIKTLVTKIRGINAVPILATVPPTALAPWRQQTVQRQNAFLRDYANRNGIALVDFYALLVDPVTGGFKAAYYNDGIHPNAAGYAAMGALYADVITPTLPAYSPHITLDDADPFNLVYGGCFTAASGTALPAGWTDNAGTPSGSAVSYITDPSVPGQMLQVTNTATTGIRQIARTIYMGTTTLSSAAAAGATTVTLPIRADFRGVLYIGSGSTYEVVRILSSSGGGPQTETLVSALQYAHAAGEPVVANAAPGDLLAFSGRVSSDAGVAVTTTAVAYTSSLSTISTQTAIGSVVAPFTRGVWSSRVTVPANTGAMTVNLQNNNGTGTVAWGQVSLYNLTRMGVA
jgi:lysophospholipase L1-like esterase